jgi:uncharacterized protein YecE (DUF72 family)
MERSESGAGRCNVGTAGWPLPPPMREAFGPGASLLKRYATRMTGVEINSSFYRPHQPATYARWAAAVPGGFRFSVKLPKAITHERRLAEAEPLLDDFLSQAGHLGDKLGCVLVQLPPSLALNEAQAAHFFSALRQRHEGAVVLEPRHRTWFSDAGRALLASHGIGLVRADPLPCADAGWPLEQCTPVGGTVYYRLHGSPRMYYSAYEEPCLQTLARRMAGDARQAESVWCIFDNTAEGAATADALRLLGMLELQSHAPAAQNRK